MRLLRRLKFGVFQARRKSAAELMCEKAKKNKAKSLVFKVSRDPYPFPVAAGKRA